ncbi:MAG: hypothetical protein Q7U53_14080 [Anaerolineaceae bacterium]|nr:hypothetical protein [Anaerolineaceae bacterium]
MSPIHFQTTYSLSHQYDAIKSRAPKILGKFIADTKIYNFNDQEKTLTFTSERLIPEVRSARQRVLLLFSNPHPHSIQQGMFLSPSINGRLSLFWQGMEDAGWFSLPEENPCPKCLAETFFKLNYESPFELLFYCYYSFPTRYPVDIVKLFGKDFFEEVIEQEAREEFLRIMQQEAPAAVVTFNKGVFNLVSTESVGKYIERLKAGEVIQSQVRNVGREVPIFLTYPTGWRYDKEYREYRRKSLERVKGLVFRG